MTDGQWIIQQVHMALRNPRVHIKRWVLTEEIWTQLAHATSSAHYCPLPWWTPDAIIVGKPTRIDDGTPLEPGDVLLTAPHRRRSTDAP